MASQPHREEFHAHQALIPELGHCGHFRYPRANPEGLRPHRHVGFWELTCVLAGRLRWRIGDEEVTVPPGHAVWTRPGEEHGGIDRAMDASEAIWVQASAEHLDQGIAAALGQLRRRVFRVPVSAPTLAFRILTEYREQRPTSASASRAAFHLMLLELVEAHNEARDPRPTPAVVRALELIDRRHLSVAGAARLVGLSVGRLGERCVAELGVSPAACVAARRIDRACAVLAAGGSVEAAAEAAGFATRAHFSNVFRRQTSLPPAAWRVLHVSITAIPV